MFQLVGRRTYLFASVKNVHKKHRFRLHTPIFIAQNLLTAHILFADLIPNK